jgi:hypothetical protein
VQHTATQNTRFRGGLAPLDWHYLACAAAAQGAQRLPGGVCSIDKDCNRVCIVSTALRGKGAQTQTVCVCVCVTQTALCVCVCSLCHAHCAVCCARAHSVCVCEAAYLSSALALRRPKAQHDAPSVFNYLAKKNSWGKCVVIVCSRCGGQRRGRCVCVCIRLRLRSSVLIVCPMRADKGAHTCICVAMQHTWCGVCRKAA